MCTTQQNYYFLRLGQTKRTKTVPACIMVRFLAVQHPRLDVNFSFFVSSGREKSVPLPCIETGLYMIDRQTVERIKDAANIVEVVSEFVALKKAGANYKGLCPFHNEKTPSFFVSPARGTCHCFGCGKGGTPVNFVMEHEQMT